MGWTPAVIDCTSTQCGPTALLLHICDRRTHSVIVTRHESAQPVNYVKLGVAVTSYCFYARLCKFDCFRRTLVRHVRLMAWASVCRLIAHELGQFVLKS